MGEIVAAAPAAFDGVAARYDDAFEPHAGHLRSVMLDAMLRTFHPGDHLLDINCGTGTDAIALGTRGFRVTAVDGSPEMIEAFKKKLTGLPAGPMLDPRTLSFEELGELPAGAFDGAISNFGGLNCADDPAGVLRSLARLLRPGAPFIACLLNSFSIWEFTAFTARFQFRRALRRSLPRSGTLARVGTGTIRVRYYSPGRWRSLLEPAFAVERVFGLSIISPPPDSHRFIARHPRLVRRLLSADDHLRTVPPFSFLGDHVVVIARRQ